MLKILLNAVLILSSVKLFAQSQISVSEVEKIVQDKLGLQTQQVIQSPLANFWEVDFADNNNQKKVLYLTKDGKYLFVGNLINLQDNQNLTQNRVLELNKINFNNLPFKYAYPLVYGNKSKSYKLALIVDPKCIYCKQLENVVFPEVVKEVTNLTVYYFFYPLPIHKGADLISEILMLYPDPAAAIKFWFQNDNLPPLKPPFAQIDISDPESAINKLKGDKDLNLKLNEAAQKLSDLQLILSGNDPSYSTALSGLSVQATPAMIFANGMVVYGVVPAETIVNYLKQK